MYNFVITDDLFNYSYEYTENGKNKAVFVNRLQEFIDSVNKQGYNTTVLSKYPFSYDLKDIHSDNNIYLVNLIWAKQLYNFNKNIKGLLYNNNFKFTDLKEKISLPIIYPLNGKNIKITIKDLLELNNKIDLIFNYKKIFCKPNCGNKIFCGFVGENTKDIIEELKYNSIVKNNPNIEIILSAYKDIEPLEYRFWVANGNILTHSTYTNKKTKFHNIVSSNLLYKMCNIIISNKLDNCTVDFAINNEDPFIIETNAISTSGLYEADFEKLIKGLVNYMEKN